MSLHKTLVQNIDHDHDCADLHETFKILQEAFLHTEKKWYFVTKIVLTYCEKKLF